MRTIKFYLDFGGFYDSWHSDNLDSLIENFQINDERINWNETFNEYSKEFVKELNEWLNLDLEFVGLYSPRFYNFENDKIDVEMNENDYNKILDNYLKDEKCIEYINESSKSRSGFISFCSGVENLKQKPELLLQYIFSYILWEEKTWEGECLTYEIALNIYENLSIVEKEIFV